MINIIKNELKHLYYKNNSMVWNDRGMCKDWFKLERIF